MSVQDIGFYSLTDERVRTASESSPMQRCEVLITGICNFKCPYCRGPRDDAKGHLPLEKAIEVIDLWADDGLVNIRFSGGEPTTHPDLIKMIEHARERGIKRIAISTNGSAHPDKYRKLFEAGANDFSISLDACCASDGDKMAGRKGVFGRIVDNIKMLSKLTYMTVGIVITEDNVDEVANIVRFAHGLGVADIRVISAAQYNALLAGVTSMDPEIVEAHPILKYRVENIKAGRNVRGIRDQDAHTCHMLQDDSVIVGDYHYPCVIHMRERGEPIGRVGPDMRAERVAWMKSHDPHKDPVCKKNCLDVCRAFNNAVEHR